MLEQGVVKLMNVEELAAFLDVPRSWVYDRTRRGAIPVMRRVGKYIRFDAFEVAAWVKAGCPRKWEATGNAEQHVQ